MKPAHHVGLFPDKIEVTGKDGAPIGSEVARVTFVLPDNGRRVVPLSAATEQGGGEKKKPSE